MKFELLINIGIAKINGMFMFKSPKPVIYRADEFVQQSLAFNVYEEDIFHTQLS